MPNRYGKLFHQKFTTSGIIVEGDYSISATGVMTWVEKCSPQNKLMDSDGLYIPYQTGMEFIYNLHK